MSVLGVFGANLRQMVGVRGTQASIAEDLGIGRVQFQRYLRGDSFPKPHVLKRICDYFGVDARILTDPLTPGQVDLIGAGVRLGGLPDAVGRAIHEGIAFACPDQSYFGATDTIPDGLYENWRGSMSRKDCAIVSLVQIKTLREARVLRGVERRELHPGGASLRKREYRGILLNQKAGFAALFFHSEPSRVVSLVFLAPVEIGGRTAAAGFGVLARGSLPGMNRVTRTIWVKLEPTAGEVMRVARSKLFWAWDEVPHYVVNHIRPGGETF